MTTLFIVLVMLTAGGCFVTIRGLVPTKPALSDQLEYYASTSQVDWSRPTNASLDTTMVVLNRLHRSNEARFIADMEITGRSASKHLFEIAQGAIGAGGLLYFLLWQLASGGIIAGAFSLIGGVIFGYYAVDHDLKVKARKRRNEFGDTLVAFLSLMSTSMAGGSGLNTAMRHTLSLGEGWVVEAIGQTVDEAEFGNETPWEALQRLGERLQLPDLIELAATLNLVGTSGAQVSKTLAIRADSGRKRLIEKQKSVAAAKSGAMGMPLGLMTLAWMFFLGYPAIAALLAS